MAYKTQYGSHYHLTYGCHGATIPCDASGLTPCSDCCGGEGGAAGPMLGGSTRIYSKGYDPETGTVPVKLSGDAGNGSIVPVYDEDGHLTGVKVVGEDGTEFQLEDSVRADAEETLRQAAIGATGGAPDAADTDGLSSLEGAEIALREADRARMASGREDDLKAADQATSAGASSRTAPTIQQEDILERIASLEQELAALRAQAETEKAFPESDPESPFLLAERSLDEETRAYIEKVYGKVTPELYAEHIVDAVSLIAYEVPADMRESGRRQIDDAVVLERIADRLEAEGYADKLDAEVEKRLGWDGDTEAIKAIGIVRARQAERRREAQRDAEASVDDALRKVRQRQQERATAKTGAKAETGESEAKPARKPTRRRRATKKVDPLGGMTPEQEQDAFDKEFSTRSIEGYMGANGYEGSKSGKGLWGKELSGAVRTDMKEWLGHLGVPKGAVRVASHTYSGGQSLKVEARLDRGAYGASESEFKAAYRKHFWRMTPQWGTVETSTGHVDVSKLMERGDAGPLMEDIIDTAWRKYQAGETEVDCGRGGAWGNPRHEIYLNEQGRKVARRMQQIVDAYNYDESNGQVDYFDSGFYAYPKVRLS